jgi:hypothetical protein
MFFLLRMAFWLGVVCLLLPGSGPRTSDPQLDATQAMTVASAAVSDARGFCGRQPDACVAGGKVAAALGEKAEAGARTLFQFITARLADKPSETDKSVTVAPTAQNDKPAAKLVKVSEQTQHGTLTKSDMQPSWHAPVPLPPKRERPGRPAV